MSLLRRILPLAVAATVMFAPTTTRAGIVPIFVDADATGDNNGSSWADAYTDLQTAMAVASNPAEIWVAEGVYLPDQADDTKTFVLENGVSVLGGFAGSETARDQRDPSAHRTVLSGSIDGGNVQSDTIIDATTVGPTAVLDGFEISGSDGGSGAGSAILVGDGGPALRNLLVRSNSSSGSGAGMWIANGQPIVEDSVFSGNVALYGGAVSNAGGKPVFRGVSFIGNAARDAGAFGQFGNDGAPEFEDARFVGNTAASSGGAIWFESSSKPSLRKTLFLDNHGAEGGAVYDQGADSFYENVTFSRNSSTAGGGAIFFDELNGSQELVNITVAGNRASTGGAFYNRESSPHIRNSIAWDNGSTPIVEEPTGGSLTLVRSLLQGGCVTGTTCDPSDILVTDPGLLDLSENGGFAESHGFQYTSPAVDAGDNNGCPEDDQRHEERPVDGDLDGTSSCDLGAFEFAPGEPLILLPLFTKGGPESATTVKVDVVLSEPSTSTISLKFKVDRHSSATGGGVDFTLNNGTLTFPPRVTKRQIILRINNDGLDEPTETVAIRLFSPTGARIGNSFYVYSISDDDPRRSCRGRPATIVGTAGGDTLTGTKGPDVIVALGGNDTIDGGAGDDLVCAGGGNDRVAGGNGNDVAIGGPGGDTLRGGDGDDALYGGAGRDRLEGQAGTGDVCDGGPGTDSTPGAHGCEASAGVP